MRTRAPGDPAGRVNGSAVARVWMGVLVDLIQHGTLLRVHRGCPLSSLRLRIVAMSEILNKLLNFSAHLLTTADRSSSSPAPHGKQRSLRLRATTSSDTARRDTAQRPDLTHDRRYSLSFVARAKRQRHSQHSMSKAEGQHSQQLSEDAIHRATSPSSRPNRTKTPTQADPHPHSAQPETDPADLDIDEQQLLAETGVSPDLQRKASRGTLAHFLSRRRSQHVRGQRREKVKMVGQHLHDHLHNAFKSWFRDVSAARYVARDCMQRKH